MDPIEYAAVARAIDALQMVATADYAQTTNAALQAKRKGFLEVCLRHMAGGPAGPDWEGASRVVKEFIEKATAAATRDELLADSDDLTRIWLGSISDLSLLDSLKQYALAVPPQVTRVMMASGSVGSSGEETELKLLRKFMLAKPSVDPFKAVACIAVTREMLNAGGPAFIAAFERELASAVTKASNDELLTVVTALAGSDVNALPSVGDPLLDLRQGLQAAEPAYGYTIAAEPGWVADLATRIEAAPGFGVRGGTFRPGISIIAVDDHIGMTILPASRMAVFDGGLEIRSAGEAAVNMADDPQSPSELVSLWQTGTVGLLAERHFHVGGHVSLVTVGPS